MSAVVRTKSTSVDDPLAAQCPVFVGYCVVHSAEFGPVWTGDLGRSEAVASIARHPPRLDPLRTWLAERKSGLHVPLGVLTWVASIHGLLW